jgi:hypothetical protein
MLFMFVYRTNMRYRAHEIATVVRYFARRRRNEYATAEWSVYRKNVRYRANKIATQNEYLMFAARIASTARDITLPEDGINHRKTHYTHTQHMT